MKLPFKPLGLALGAAAVAYALVLLLTRPTPPQEVLRHLLSPSALLAAALCVLNYVLRGLRWRLWMAHFQRPLGLADGLRIYLAGYSFTPTPGNIGEAARGLLLAQRPLSALQSLAIFGAERLADLLALLLLTLPALFWLLVLPNIAGLPWLVGGLGLAGGLLAVVLLRAQPSWLTRWAWLAQAWDCLRTQPMRWFGLTLVAWAAQGLAVWLICQDMALPIGPLQATSLYALAMVGGAVSMLPAGLGGTEALLTGLLVLQGASLATAVGITVLVRLLTLWLAVAIGLLALLYSAAFRKDLSFR